ncbi:DUF2249 domain-containing protein [Rhodococcus sp. H36-A4]|uniref:DUF2249 domain-containing protein n=1 Tax=Rhodococcus sp. H36-A4 TaxID=3004353 RepID=UPI0022AFDE5A|nr:DUF2249 domain-containing protein [Rhodococcus sp. H36-A4]MCZ4078690.1 DUF2249 domain-containing protein [Rhodococcus sp. H36-A4]
MEAATHTLVTKNTDDAQQVRPVEKDKVKTRRVFKGPGVTMIRLSIDSGAVMTEHTAAVPIVLQSISGNAVIEVGGERIDMSAGAIVHVDAHVPHSVEAITPAHLLLLLLERAPSEKAKTPDAIQEPARSDVVLASTGADAAAIEAVLDRHAEVSGALSGYATRVIDAAIAGDQGSAVGTRIELLAWCSGPLADLLDAEAADFGRALREIDEALADRVVHERDAVVASSLRVAQTQSAAEGAAEVAGLRVHLGQYLRTYESRVLPALAQSKRALAALWATVEAQTSTVAAGEGHAATDHVCECGVVDEPELPELDVRTVPHAIRHATVFGALDALHAGAGMILIAPHDPLPLLAQIEQRTPGRFEVSYLERGPQAWRLQLSNTASHDR